MSNISIYLVDATLATEGKVPAPMVDLLASVLRTLLSYVQTKGQGMPIQYKDHYALVCNEK